MNDDGTKTYLFPNLRQLALNHTRIVEGPGEHFLYNNYHPLLLGMIIERATGVFASEYLERKIWQPLRMEFDGSWSLDSEESGFEKMESGINARAVDFAKFGRLFLHNGNWNGVQVIPANWVIESTREDPAVDRSEYYGDLEVREPLDGYYKYMWWGVPRDEGAYDFAAVGNLGQFIYISPQADLVIVRNGEKYGIHYDEWLQIFYQFASSIGAPMMPDFSSHFPATAKKITASASPAVQSPNRLAIAPLPEKHWERKSQPLFQPSDARSDSHRPACREQTAPQPTLWG